MFKNKIEKHEEEKRSIFCLVQCGFAHDIPRTYGYSPLGDRCYGTQEECEVTQI